MAHVDLRSCSSSMPRLSVTGRHRRPRGDGTRGQPSGEPSALPILVRHGVPAYGLVSVRRRRDLRDRSASCNMYAVLACRAISARTSGSSRPSGSTCRSKRSRKPCVPAAVRARRSVVLAQDAWAAMRARRRRCSGVSPVDPAVCSSGSDTFTDPDARLAFLGAFGGCAGAVVSGHVV